ncbi:hypothetical protein C7N43_13385 [Sphingobacteriales bacterium UPWRP_1]|nr:hypothetical protein B6N25_03520 [Sphingobacteriales bacterium TSM_CSS]PSJ76519.1 hypothetical protein C7N43_13385 [Sphingobacteriales bacterium UPWRP_1]
MEKKYTNGEITVIWKPELCMHSANCFKGLPQVFNPRNRPWVNLQNANTEQVIAQVKACPSGALSFFVNNEIPEPVAEQEQALPNVTVEVLPNGPLLVKGAIQIIDANAQITIKESNTAFCRCGHSANKPFCDGTHKKTGFVG